ncbi:MAG: hypothetical protein QW511_04515 [Candidatus Methanomethylicia archaeon]
MRILYHYVEYKLSLPDNIMHQQSNVGRDIGKMELIMRRKR